MFKSSKKIFFIFTCEHAENKIPKEYQRYLKGSLGILNTHRGFDLGTKKIGSAFARKFKAPVVLGKYSRLLMDLNRSANHSKAFSEMTKMLNAEEKMRIQKRYYDPHREKIKSIIKTNISKGHLVIHIGVHSFTPVLNNIKRTADIGILYDPQRKKEQELANLWQDSLEKISDYQVRRNYPYLGKLDGLTSSFRKQFSEKNYLGLELEMNHRCLDEIRLCQQMQKCVVESLWNTLRG